MPAKPFTRNDVLAAVVLLLQTPWAWPVIGNTGTGGIPSVARLAGIQAGIYQIVLDSATAFHVLDPKGNNLGSGTVGTAWSVQVGFTLSAGGTPFVARDSFAVFVLTAAASGVIDSPDWPTPETTLPAALVWIERDEKESKAGAHRAAMFRTTLTLVIAYRVSAPSDGVAGPGAKNALRALSCALEGLIFSSNAVTQYIEDYGASRTEIAYSSEGNQRVAEVRFGFALIYSERFQPYVWQPLGGIDIFTDAQNIAVDHEGTYPADGIVPDSPVADPNVPAAPRTTGPDNRIEIGAEVDLTPP
jgi:hypothetical protein